MGFIKKLFSKKEPLRLDDPDFGEIVYMDDVGKDDDPYWEMQTFWEIPEKKAKIQCVGIPGDSEGPYDYARQFLLSKRDQLDALWKLCSEELSKQIELWYPDLSGKQPRDIFTLNSINMDSEDEWEVCFEADPAYKWIYLGYQIKGTELISGTVDT